MPTYVEIWTIREDVGGAGTTAADLDLTDMKVEATDGEIGKIDEATNDIGGSYIVVDTGPWIFGKKVMLPAGVIERVDLDTETVYVNQSKDEIKNAPEYDENRRDDETYREELGSYYGRRDEQL